MTPQQREALLWVRNCLDPNHPQVMPDWMKFDMSTWMSTTNCGTACCIGGSMDVYMAGFARDEREPSLHVKVRNSFTYAELERTADAEEGLYNLFFRWSSSPLDPTPENAVKAIDAYLAGNPDPWSVVC